MKRPILAAPGGLSPAAYPLLPTQPQRPGDKLELANESAWRTADLKRFFRAGLRYLGLSERRRIRVQDSRRGYGAHGHASIGGRQMTLWLALPAGPEAQLDCAALGRLFLHELEHNLGLQHKQMTERCTRPGNRFVPWAAGLVVRAKLPRAEKPKPAASERREAQTRAGLARWEKRAAAAQRRVRKLRARVRYYERRRAAGSTEARP